MVLEEISQLIEDCDVKRATLSSYRESINHLQKSLLKLASQRLEKTDLTDLEHYQNQFHIQLINIHDLKHDLKAYQHRLRVESHLHDGVSQDTLSKHKELADQYDLLDKIIKDLNSDFESFMTKPH